MLVHGYSNAGADHNPDFTIKALTPQNGQTHSNNSSATADKLYECV